MIALRAALIALVLCAWAAPASAIARPDGSTLLLGYDLEYDAWAGLFAPRAIPPAVFKTLREGVRQAVQDPELRAAMDKVQTASDYRDADELWDRDAQRLAEVVKRIGRVEDK